VTIPGPSYLDGAEWVLHTRVSRVNAHGSLTHDAAIRATAATRGKWNDQFWQLFPAASDEFATAVRRGEVSVSIMFRFRPTVRMQEQYGGHSVLKIARASQSLRGQTQYWPQALADAVDEYDEDKRRLEEQRRHAWSELLHLRLPIAPTGYFWELTAGDARSYSDVLTFELKAR